MTGAELAAELDRLLQRTPGLSKRKIGLLVDTSFGGVEHLRKRKVVSQRIITRVRKIIASPPSSAFTDYGPKNPCQGDAWYEAHNCDRPFYQGTDRYARPPEPRRGLSRSEKVVAGMKSANRRRAIKALDAGVNPNTAKPTWLKLAMMEVQKERNEAARLVDPVEMAKLTLRRERIIVYSLSIKGGPKDSYFVSCRREPVSADELVALAKKYAERRAA